MTANASSGDGAVLARAGGGDLAAPGSAPSGLTPDQMMEQLVDAVVDKLEQRVVEELERRGRRQSWGAF